MIRNKRLPKNKRIRIQICKNSQRTEYGRPWREMRKLTHNRSVVGGAYASMNTDYAPYKCRTTFMVSVRTQRRYTSFARNFSWNSPMSPLSTPLTFPLPGFMQVCVGPTMNVRSVLLHTKPVSSDSNADTIATITCDTAPRSTVVSVSLCLLLFVDPID